ncbi:MAG: tubulin beta chain [Verrucomicrobiaceae bacterium]|nr:tubulin beta chain [Verrucomicrobiaceae bacterium]
MMKVNNTIVVSVGQAGNQIAASFWKTICQEHGIDPLTGQTTNGADPRGNWSSFFTRLGESTSSSYVPRAVMVDLEPSVIETVKASSGSLFNPASLITRSEGAGGNFAVGYLGEGRALLPEVMTRIENEIEKTDNVGGIIVIHALGGGTGSGLGSLIIESIKERHPEAPILSCAILPSPQVSSVVTEPYNTVFALNTLRRVADACLIFDNEALFQLAHKKWNIENPSVDDLNLLITEALAGLTASMRFSGFLTVEISLREMLTNLVPQPSLHFLMLAFAPLTPPDRSKFEEMGVEEMIRSLFDNDNVFAACSPMEGRFLSTAVLYRGAMEDKPQADAALAAMREQLPLTYWIPTAFKIGYVEQAGTAHRKSMVLLANNTEVARVLDRICHNFDKLWQRKAFANWYLNEGMSEDQINALRASAQELIQSYQVAEESGAKAKIQDSPDVAARASSREASSSDASSSSTVSLRDLVDKRRN